MSRESPTFETIDWNEHTPSRFVVDRSTLAFLLSLTTLVAVYLYDLLFVPSGIVLFGWFSPAPLDWLTGLSILLIVFYGIVPLVRDYELTLRYWRRLRRKPAAMVSLAYLALVVFAGLFGPELYGKPSVASFVGSIEARGGIPPTQPPYGTSIATAKENLLFCGVEPVGGRCPGTLTHPLGTTVRGNDMLAVVIAGARFTIKVAAITAAILVPLGTGTGVIAAYVGGWTDGVITRYLDLQGVLPSFLVYFLYQFLYGPSVAALVVLFGFLGWDRVARRVRTDALRLRDAGFVRSAEAAGSRPTDILRRHLVPNVSATVVSALTIQLPFILLMEATFAYFGLVGAVGGETITWGGTIAFGFRNGTWWEYTFPAVALIGTIVALATLGNALYDTFETRREAS